MGRKNERRSGGGRGDSLVMMISILHSIAITIIIARRDRKTNSWRDKQSHICNQTNLRPMKICLHKAHKYWALNQLPSTRIMLVFLSIYRGKSKKFDSTRHRCPPLQLSRCQATRVGRQEALRMPQATRSKMAGGSAIGAYSLL